jgi:hypothetical protein
VFFIESDNSKLLNSIGLKVYMMLTKYYKSGKHYLREHKEFYLFIIVVEKTTQY